MRIWIDVEDFFVFAASGGRRPTGIQRLAFELCQAMLGREPSAPIAFVRHDRLHDTLAVVPWASIVALFAGLTEAAARPASAPQAAESARLRGLLGRLPPDLRAPLVLMLKSQVQALSAAGAALRATLRLAIGALRRTQADAAQGDRARFAAEVTPGDMLFIPGAAFVHSDYPAFIARLASRHGLRVALLVYDIIPVRRPEYVDPGLTRRFGTWLDGMLPLCDRLMAISRSAAGEATAHAATNAIALRDAIHPIPIGTGFSGQAEGTQSPGLPAPGSYVLFVSTIEARKNHLLLFRVWRRLLDTMPPGAVPTLVFAGKPGAQSGDLMAMLHNTVFLGGHIRLIDQPSDADLAALYRGCLFTLFPSHYEGWGLPVTESLAFGKPCLISNATSLPEAGGDLARYFDPEDVPGATALIRATLENREDLAAWTRRVATEFRPVSWQESARAVMEHIA